MSLDDKQIPVYSLITQSEINAEYPIQDNSSVYLQQGAVGAILGAALDASANAKHEAAANENLAALRNKLQGLDFDLLFEQELSKKLKDRVKFSGISTVKTRKDAGKYLPPGDLFLVFNTAYLLASEYRTPLVFTQVTLYEKGIRKDNVLFTNDYRYYGYALAPFVKTKADEKAAITKVNAEYMAKSKQLRRLNEEKVKYFKAMKQAKADDFSFNEKGKLAVDIWSTHKLTELETLLRNSIVDLLSYVRDDITDTTDPHTYKGQGSTLDGYPKKHKSMVLKEDEERMVIRFTSGFQSGSICSMPKKQVVDYRACL